MFRVAQYYKTRFLRLVVMISLLVLPILIGFNSCTASRFSPDLTSLAKNTENSCISQNQSEQSLVQSLPNLSKGLNNSFLEDINQLKVFNNKIYLATGYGLHVTSADQISWSEIPNISDLPSRLIRSINFTSARRIVTTQKGIREWNIDTCEWDSFSATANIDASFAYHDEINKSDLVATVQGDLYVKASNSDAFFVNSSFFDATRLGVINRTLDAPITGLIGINEVVLVGTKEGLFISLDGGFAFVKSSGITGEDTTIIFDIVKSRGLFFLATQVGAFVSADMGANWQAISFQDGQGTAIQVQQVLDIEVNSARVYAATDKGLFWVDLSGPETDIAAVSEIWQSISISNIEPDELFTHVSVEGEVIAIASSSSARSLAVDTTDNSGRRLNISLNHGVDWLALDSKVLITPLSEKVPLEFKSKGGMLLAFSANPLIPFYFSSDKGDSWESFAFSDATRPPLCSGAYAINDMDLSFAPSQPITMLVSTTCGLFKTENPLLQWVKLDVTLDLAVAEIFEVNSVDDLIIVQGHKMSVTLPSVPLPGFYYSGDGGVQWEFNFDKLLNTCFAGGTATNSESEYALDIAFDINRHFIIDCPNSQGEARLAIANLYPQADGVIAKDLKNINWDFVDLEVLIARPVGLEMELVTIKDIAMAGDEILVSYDIGTTSVPGSFGILYSIDLGLTWNRLELPAAVINISQLLTDFLSIDGKIYLSTASHGVLATLNLGRDWFVYGQADGLLDSKITNIFSDAEYLYSATVLKNSLNKLYRMPL